MTLETNTSIYMRDNFIIAVYADDISIFGPSKTECYKVYNQLSRHFKIVDKGHHVKSFLGVDMTRNWEKRTIITIDQCGYIDQLLNDFWYD